MVEGWFKAESQPGVDRPLTERDVLEMVGWAPSWRTFEAFAPASESSG